MSSPSPSPSIGLLVGRWGGWPGWMPFLLRGFTANPDITFHLLCDVPPKGVMPPNVLVHPTTLPQLAGMMKDAVGLNLTLEMANIVRRGGGGGGLSMAKINDLKPLWGETFGDTILRGYEWWGYLQEDVLLGDLLACLPARLLQAADVISPAMNRAASGVFSNRRERYLNHTPDELT